MYIGIHKHFFTYFISSVKMDLKQHFWNLVKSGGTYFQLIFQIKLFDLSTIRL